MIIEEIKDFYAFLNLEKEWNLLLKKSYSSSVFLSHEWLRCWWEAFGKGKELLILLCKDEDHVLGAFPLMITRDSIHGFPVKKISFIENNETPHCGFLIDNKASLLEIVHALFGHIALYKKSWDILGLRKIPEGNKIIEFVRNYLDDNGYNFIIRKSLQSPILYIKTDWDTFYSGATQRFKKRIRYSINKLRKEGNFFVNKIQKSDEMSSMLEEAFRVGNLSWKGNIGKSIGNTPENRHFFSILPSAL
ncbi:MAG: hypothetical protein SVR08_18295, partial [Spirochaetota bacterium]|nr:hypothetical protein [Spirochaetota bacterium]